MSEINTCDTREPAILSVLFPIPFIMSDIEEEVVAPATPEEETTEETTTEAPAEVVAPTETETPTAE